VLIAPFIILTGDLLAYGRWGELALYHFFDAYSYGATNPDWVYWPGYEPLALYMYGLLEGLYFGAAHLIGHNPSHDPMSSHVFRLVLKLPVICADLGIVCFIYAFARRVMTPTRALIASATYAFTPGILIVTLLWGQTDGFVLLLIIVGLYFAYRQQGIWAGVMLALAIGFKPQPAIFIPLGLVYLYRWAGLREALRALASLAGVTLALWLPYLLPPRFEVLSYLQIVRQIVQVQGPEASKGAFNLWILIQAGSNPVSQPLLGPFSIQLVSAALFATVMLLVLAGIWRDGSQRMLWIGAALLALGFFDVGTLQFERYLTPAVALFLLAAICDRRYWLCYIGVSAMLYLNFAATIFDCRCYAPAMALPHQVAHLLTLDLQPTIGAAINMAVLIVGIYWFMFPNSLFPGKRFHGAVARQSKPAGDGVAAPVGAGLLTVV
jgi:Gpi18-like mannosyltransferase